MCRRRLVSLMRCRNECIAAKTAGDARSIATNETYDSLKGMNLLPAGFTGRNRALARAIFVTTDCVARAKFAFQRSLSRSLLDY